MKQLLFLLSLSLVISSVAIAQEVAEPEKKERPNELLSSMFETELAFEKPTDDFIQIFGQTGYEEAKTKSKIVAMFIPVDYAVIHKDFLTAKETDERVTGSGEIPYGKTTGYYNQISIPAPEDSEQENFVGIIAIIPSEKGTINMSAVCPESKSEDYIPLFLKAIETVHLVK